MLRRGRAVVDNFALDEPLYWRCNREHVAALPGSGLAVRFPDFSVNRGGAGFGPPEDVLLPSWPNWGVAAFLVRDIPARLDTEAATYTFGVVHLPDDYNYAHSEVRTYKGGLYEKDMEIKSKAIKKQFRQLLGEKTIIIIQPKV